MAQTAAIPLQSSISVSTDLATSCANCRYAVPSVQPGTFECRANAPAPSSPGAAADWPLVEGPDWCGIWQSATAPTVPAVLIIWTVVGGAITNLEAIEFASLTAAQNATHALIALGFQAAAIAAGP